MLVWDQLTNRHVAFEEWMRWAPRYFLTTEQRVRARNWQPYLQNQDRQ
jgi:hypothetical protein